MSRTLHVADGLTAILNPTRSRNGLREMGTETPKSDVCAALARQRQRQTILGNGGWYFRTRERIDVGPFPSSAEAMAASRRLTELLARVTAPSQARKVILSFGISAEPPS